MKLLACPDCGDVFQLRLNKMRTCDCGKVKGRYITNSLAEVSKEGISIAIGNGGFMQAYARMLDLQKKTNDQADRQQYIKDANLIYAWVRPNTGNGNPHTTIIEENEEKKIPHIKTGDQVYSDYFKKWLTILEIENDANWWFSLDGKKTKAQTPLHHFIEKGKYKQNGHS